MTCSQSNCVPKARVPSAWLTVLACHPSVNRDGDDAADRSAELAATDSVHYFTKQIGFTNVVGSVSVLGAPDNVALGRLRDVVCSGFVDILGRHRSCGGQPGSSA